MAFRYLIYRTDYGNTIVRESATSSATGGTEQELFTDFVIPAIQPLYLWRVTGGTSVVPNTDQNIEDWLNTTNPPDGDDPITYSIFSGYTGQTASDIIYISGQTDNNTSDITYISGQTDNLNDDVSYISGATDQNSDDITFISGVTDQNTSDISLNSDDIAYVSGQTVTFNIFNSYTAQTANDITYISGVTDNKIDKVPSATTGNIGKFTADGGLEDTGYSAEDFLIGATGGTDYITFTGYTATTDNRFSGIEDDIAYISGQTDNVVGDLEDDIAYISGVTDQNTSDISSNSDDIAYISGITDTKQDQLSSGAGISSTKLSNDIVELDLSAFTAVGDVNISITGSTNAVINDLRTIAKGFEYGSDYAANFTVRSLVDKGYVDAIASGLDLKESVRVATTTGETDIDLTLGTFGGTIDGVALADGDRVLIKNQDSDQSENGIYVYSSSSSTFARSIDFQNPYVTSGAFTFVSEGTKNAASGWVLVNTDPVDVGVDDLVFTQFSEAGDLTAGVGINITNGVISFAGASVAGDSITWSGTQLNIDISTGNTLGNALATKLNISDFNTYSGITDTRISDIEDDINYISGQTDSLVSDLEDDITYISGVTDTKLNTDIFTGYTASTEANELFLIHTGGTDINTITPTTILWDTVETNGLLYSYSASTGTFRVLEAGDYEITYNIPFTQAGNSSDRGIGGNIVINGAVLDNSAGAGWSSRSNATGAVALPSINVNLSANDVLGLILFRTATSGVTNTLPNGTLLIKRKNKLQ
jgi:hypothetical protein